MQIYTDYNLRYFVIHKIRVLGLKFRWIQNSPRSDERVVLAWLFATLIVFHRLRKQNLFIIYTEYLGQDSYSNYKKVIEIEISNIFNTWRVINILEYVLQVFTAPVTSTSYPFHSIHENLSFNVLTQNQHYNIFYIFDSPIDLLS